MFEQELNIHRFARVVERRNSLHLIKRKNAKKKFFSNGFKLFQVYGYSLVSLSIIVKLYSYLSDLNSLYGKNKSFDIFLDNTLHGGIFLSIVCAVLYCYSFISYFLYPKYLKIKKVQIDALLINFFYFFIFGIALLFKKDELYLYYMFLVLASILIFFYLKKKEKILFICQNCNRVVMKTLNFTLLAYFLLNIENIFYIIYLIIQDMINRVVFV